MRPDPSPVRVRIPEAPTGNLGLFGRGVIAQRTVATVPELAGVDLAWRRDPAIPDRIVLRHAVNCTTSLIDDLAVPVRYGASRRDNALGDRITRTLVDVAAGMAAAELVAERARHTVDAAARAERRRIARELQDAVGATLLALRYGIRHLAAVPGLDHDIRSRLTDIEAQAVDAVAALRRCLHLSSATPARVPLRVAIRAHCDAFQRRTAVATRLTTLTDLPPITASRVAALADAAREGLLNVEKHARAQSVVATIFAVADRVAVTISDDGVGLPCRAALEHGLGIAAVGEGLARVGGALTIAPNEDGGVTMHAWVPT